MRKITESEIEQFAIELFEKSDFQYIYAPTKHLKNIFDSGELDEKSNVQKMHIALSDDKNYISNFDVAVKKLSEK